MRFGAAGLSTTSVLPPTRVFETGSESMSVTRPRFRIGAIKLSITSSTWRACSRCKIGAQSRFPRTNIATQVLPRCGLVVGTTQGRGRHDSHWQAAAPTATCRQLLGLRLRVEVRGVVSKVVECSAAQALGALVSTVQPGS